MASSCLVDFIGWVEHETLSDFPLSGPVLHIHEKRFSNSWKVSLSLLSWRAHFLLQENLCCCTFLALAVGHLCRCTNWKIDKTFRCPQFVFFLNLAANSISAFLVALSWTASMIFCNSGSRSTLYWFSSQPFKYSMISKKRKQWSKFSKSVSFFNV